MLILGVGYKLYSSYEAAYDQICLLFHQRQFDVSGNDTRVLKTGGDAWYLRGLGTWAEIKYKTRGAKAFAWDWERGLDSCWGLVQQVGWELGLRLGAW